jgi:hypothetical protein
VPLAERYFAARCDQPCFKRDNAISVCDLVHIEQLFVLSVSGKPSESPGDLMEQVASVDVN